MKFLELCNLFEKLESTSKRLDKSSYLLDFISKNSENGPLVFDLISGKYQKEINKKNIGISVKTIIKSIHFVSNKSEKDIERKFNQIGDVGKLAVEFIDSNKQKTLSNSPLSLKNILDTFESIKKTSGKNSNKIKVERISKLFLQADSNIEIKFLARMLIDDYRIGVSEGVLKEAYVSYVFPKIKGIHLICNNCKSFNFDRKKCLFCNVELNNIDSKKVNNENLENLLNLRDEFIEVENPREIYNKFNDIIENKFNLLNSFRKIHKQYEEDKKSLLDFEIELFNPIKSMLGVRAKNIDEALDVVGDNLLADYKYDGLRIQIHSDGNKVKLFSRNLEDITKQFPEIIEFIIENFPDISFVIDSECIGYDFEKEKFLPFQLLSRRIMTKEVDTVSHISISVKAFDLLYLNGKTLIQNNYKSRRDNLEKLFINRELRQKISN